ncbi:MAG: heme biosynthesis HemY N-terminal domain-containing protein [Candidatus Sedimenticola endophacoides]
MRGLIHALIALALSVLLIRLLQADNGYLLLGYGAWTVEGSLALFVLLDLLLFALLYLLVRTLIRFWSMPAGFRHWRQARTRRRARRAFNQGLIELSEGGWRRAERDLVRYAGHSEFPLVNYLAAARAAQLQGADERRDHYLQMAHTSMPAADVAVGLTQAELQLSHSQLEQALATLMHLRQVAPKHTYVLKLLKELYQRLGAWQELAQLLPELKKRQVVDARELLRLEGEANRERLHRAAQQEDIQALLDVWQGIPWSLRRGEALVSVYANHLLNRGQPDRAERLLRETLSRDWSDTLGELYGRVGATDGTLQLSAAEGWLEGRPENPVLLLSLARLSLRARLWGKARSYYEASITHGPSAEAYRELGALLERMGEIREAMHCYREGLGLNSPLPLPELPARLQPARIEPPAPMAPPDVAPLRARGAD